MYKKDFKGIGALLESTNDTEKDQIIKPFQKKRKIKNNPKRSGMTKVNVLMNDTQKDALDETAKTAMRTRNKGGEDGRERITANTVVRALVNVFIKEKKNLDYSDIENEKDIENKIKDLFHIE